MTQPFSQQRLSDESGRKQVRKGRRRLGCGTNNPRTHNTTSKAKLTNDTADNAGSLARGAEGTDDAAGRLGVLAKAGTVERPQTSALAAQLARWG